VTLLQPGKRTLYHPALGHDLETVQFASFDDLDSRAQGLVDSFGKRLTGITSIHQDILYAAQVLLPGSSHLQCSSPVSDVGSGDVNGMWQPIGIHGNVPLNTGHFLPSVVTFLTSGVSILDTLGVNDAKAGLGRTTMASADLAN